MPITDDDEDKNEIDNSMEQVAHDVHAEPDGEDEEDNKDDKDTCEDEKSDGHYEGDDNEEPEEIVEKPRPLVDIQDRDYIHLENGADKLKKGVASLLDIKIEDDILSDYSTVKSQIIEHPWTSYDKSLSEHQN